MMPRDRFAYARNIERATRYGDQHNAFWPPADEYHLFCLDLTRERPTLGPTFDSADPAVPAPFVLSIREGALDALFQRAKLQIDNEVAALLARLRRARLLCSDETTMRMQGQTQWNWVFQNAEVAIHVIRPSHGRAVVAEVLGGHRPAFWVSDLYSAQRGHADAWQVCLAHQLRDLLYAIDAGDTVFALRLKALLLQAVVRARWRFTLQASTRLTYRRRLERDLTALLALQPTNRHGQRLRNRFLKIRNSLFTFLEHPEVTARQQQFRTGAAVPGDLFARSPAAFAPPGEQTSAPESDR